MRNAKSKALAPMPGRPYCDEMIPEFNKIDNIQEKSYTTQVCFQHWVHWRLTIRKTVHWIKSNFFWNLSSWNSGNFFRNKVHQEQTLWDLHNFFRNKVQKTSSFYRNWMSPTKQQRCSIRSEQYRTTYRRYWTTSPVRCFSWTRWMQLTTPNTL